VRSLIIFARYPVPGEAKTRLGATLGMKRAAEVYRDFAEHAFSVGEALHNDGIEVFLFYHPSVSEKDMKGWVDRPFRFFPQEGPDLGARMEQAFATTFRQGSDASVIIGTDIPELDAPTVREGFRSLESGEVVIGPGADGGYYLCGMIAPLKDIFSGVPWGTGTVLQVTLEKVSALGLSCTTLRTLHDVDTGHDYDEYLRRRTGEGS